MSHSAAALRMARLHLLTAKNRLARINSHYKKADRAEKRLKKEADKLFSQMVPLKAEIEKTKIEIGVIRKAMVRTPAQIKASLDFYEQKIKCLKKELQNKERLKK